MSTDAKPKWSREWAGSEEMKTDFQEIWLQKGDLGLREIFFLFGIDEKNPVVSRD